MTTDEMRSEFEPVPEVTDWTVIQHARDVYIESATIAHNMRNYDDAWLKIQGNMLKEEKVALAQAIADQLNAYAAGRAAAVKEAVEPLDCSGIDKLRARAEQADGTPIMVNASLLLALYESRDSLGHLLLRERDLLVQERAAAELKPYDKAIQSGEPQLFSYDATGRRNSVRVIWPDGEGIDYVRDAAIDAAKAGRSET